MTTLDPNAKIPMSDSQVTKLPRFNRVRWVIFSLFAMPLLGVIIVTHRDATKLDNELAAVTAKSERARLEMLSVEKRKRDLAEKGEVADFQRDQLSRIYRKYREIGDFAPNPTSFIVFASTDKLHMNDTLHFSVPQGQHVFSLQIAKIDFVTKKTVNTTKLDFPIEGPAGFRVLLDLPIKKGAKYRDPRQLTLKIESNSEHFRSVSKDLLEPFSKSGSSTGSPYVRTNPVAFPNQIRSYADTDEDGVLLNKMRWSIQEKNEKRYNLEFEMRLKTDGPQVVTANGGVFIDKSKLTYAGGGKYIVKQKNEPDEE